MALLEALFWLFSFIVFYCYIGYGLVLYIFLKIKSLLSKKSLPSEGNPQFEPAVTIIIPSYNEIAYLEKKIKNTVSLDYPKEKLNILFVTDGSNDGSAGFIKNHVPAISLLHSDERKGKAAAINRAMTIVATPFVIFCDANTELNTECVKEIIKHYKNPKVGAVAGEKKIIDTKNTGLSGVGEGAYWKYESFLKKLDSEFYTVVGAAGELFSIRTSLYKPIEPNVILDDFVISLRVCQQGYKVVYEPDAYAMEKPSESIRDEQKRKIRISAGGFQAIFILKEILNVFKYPRLSFQYISHRVLRWAVCPFLLPLIFFINFTLHHYEVGYLYSIFWYLQLGFYLFAALGWVALKRDVKIRIIIIPYYFLFMNISLYAGFLRFIKGNQSVLWEKAKR